MATGVVKVFNTDLKHGFITADETGRDAMVHVDDIPGDALTPGAIVEYDFDEETKRARAVKVVTEVVADNPAGRTMHQPPAWDVLEERDRQRRAARRRRR